MTVVTAAVPAEVVDHFHRALHWAHTVIDPTLDWDRAVTEALTDWIGLLRAEWLADQEIPRPLPPPRPHLLAVQERPR